MVTFTELVDRFRAVDAFLVQHQALWRPRPFTYRVLPWEASHPALASWLRERTLEQAEAAHREPTSLEAPEPFPTLARQALEASRLPELPVARLIGGTDEPPAGVPGRKWQQVRAFGAHLPRHDGPRHWLDWCAGKGHLGRHLWQEGDQLTCLEWDPALCAAGKSVSVAQGVAAVHRCQDVMADSASELLTGTWPVALHACGDLHVRLIEAAIAGRVDALAVAPCCYNRTQDEHYRPRSQTATHSPLTLSRDDLGLPLSETVTAGARERRQRDQSMAWRLAFDHLQRQLRKQDSYLPTPSLPVAWLKQPFARYCEHLAQLKGLAVPHAQDWQRLEAIGWRRLAEVRNLELVRGLFRRPLETWLLLDRALLLAENGYEVLLGTFCPSRLTPRNAMLVARRIR
ncbi:methyltransferase [Stutzerimonas urumqiensis]|uniref:methyltransferase n=1 Tax=Stutzerimonas urumqiensis TaxID=638269 RepID=UPI000EAFAA5D